MFNEPVPPMSKQDREHILSLMEIDLENPDSDQRGVILYVEAKCVDEGGYGNSANLNTGDMQLLHIFRTVGLLQFESYWDWKYMQPEQRHFDEWKHPPREDEASPRNLSMRDLRFEPSDKLLEVAARLRRERVTRHLTITSYEDYAK